MRSQNVRKTWSIVAMLMVILVLSHSVSAACLTKQGVIAEIERKNPDNSEIENRLVAEETLRQAIAEMNPNAEVEGLDFDGLWGVYGTEKSRLTEEEITEVPKERTSLLTSQAGYAHTGAIALTNPVTATLWGVYEAGRAIKNYFSPSQEVLDAQEAVRKAELAEFAEFEKQEGGLTIESPESETVAKVGPPVVSTESDIKEKIVQIKVDINKQPDTQKNRETKKKMSNKNMMIGLLLGSALMQALAADDCEKRNLPDCEQRIRFMESEAQKFEESKKIIEKLDPGDPKVDPLLDDPNIRYITPELEEQIEAGEIDGEELEVAITLERVEKSKASAEKKQAARSIARAGNANRMGHAAVLCKGFGSCLQADECDDGHIYYDCECPGSAICCTI